MWIKRQEGYCLKEIAGVHYLLPYGQKVADQRKGPKRTVANKKK